VKLRTKLREEYSKHLMSWQVRSESGATQNVPAKVLGFIAFAREN
jgi:hypothetical protein